MDAAFVWDAVVMTGLLVATPPNAMIEPAASPLVGKLNA